MNDAAEPPGGINPQMVAVLVAVLGGTRRAPGHGSAASLADLFQF
jgi:hypothetical protein